MRTMNQTTKEILERENDRFAQDPRTADFAASLNELDQMGFAKRSDYEPSPADTIGRRFYEAVDHSHKRKFQ